MSLHGPEYIIVGLITFWLAMLIACLLNRSLSPANKLIWTLVILLGTFPGAGIYFFVIYIPGFFKPRRAVHEDQLR